MSLRPQHYTIIASTARTIERPEPVTDPGLTVAMNLQHQLDEIDDERRYRATAQVQKRDPLPVRAELPAMPSARIDRMMEISGRRRIA